MRAGAFGSIGRTRNRGPRGAPTGGPHDRGGGGPPNLRAPLLPKGSFGELAAAAGGAAVGAAVAGAASGHDPAAVGAGRGVALPAVSFVEGAAVAVARAGE